MSNIFRTFGANAAPITSPNLRRLQSDPYDNQVEAVQSQLQQLQQRRPPVTTPPPAPAQALSRPPAGLATATQLTPPQGRATTPWHPTLSLRNFSTRGLS